MPDSYQERKSKLDHKLAERGEFVTLEDGYVYYWPRAAGALSADELRIISYILDDKNEKWNAQVKEDLGYHE